MRASMIALLREHQADLTSAGARADMLTRAHERAMARYLENMIEAVEMIPVRDHVGAMFSTVLRVAEDGTSAVVTGG